MLYTESKLRHMLTTKQCIRDTDCAFFDCESKCDATTGFCTERLNDNIDVSFYSICFVFLIKIL